MSLSIGDTVVHHLGHEPKPLFVVTAIKGDRVTARRIPDGYEMTSGDYMWHIVRKESGT